MQQFYHGTAVSKGVSEPQRAQSYAEETVRQVEV
jgi:hypothetical protein